MADMTCERELNRQLQALQARVKQLEDNVSGLNETVITDIGQTVAAFIALIAEGMVTGLPTYIANQLILKIAAAALDMTQEQLEDFPGMGAVGDFTTDLSGLSEEVIGAIFDIITSPSLEELWQQLSYFAMVPQLAIPPFSLAFLTSALASAEAAVTDAQEALSGDPLNEELQAALQAAVNLRDSMGNAADAMNDLTACKISSSVLGL